VVKQTATAAGVFRKQFPSLSPSLFPSPFPFFFYLGRDKWNATCLPFFFFFFFFLLPLCLFPPQSFGRCYRCTPDPTPPSSPLFLFSFSFLPPWSFSFEVRRQVNGTKLFFSTLLLSSFPPRSLFLGKAND